MLDQDKDDLRKLSTTLRYAVRTLQGIASQLNNIADPPPMELDECNWEEELTKFKCPYCDSKYIVVHGRADVTWHPGDTEWRFASDPCPEPKDDEPLQCKACYKEFEFEAAVPIEEEVEVPEEVASAIKSLVRETIRPLKNEVDTLTQLDVFNIRNDI